MSTLVESRALSIVRNELRRRCHGYKEKSNTIVVCCPFHNEKTPSCFVNIGSGKPVGVFYCHGCGEKGMWNKLATKIGGQLFDIEDTRAIASIAPNIANRLNSLRSSMLSEYDEADWSAIDEDLVGNMILPVNSDFRSIKLQTLQMLGCKRMIDKRTQETFILIPVYIHGEVKMIVRARKIKKNGQLSYYSSPGVKRFGLLGYDALFNNAIFQEHNVVILVEGPRDAMRLIQEGLPAVALLGANNWSEYKYDLLQELDLTKLFVLFDNDEPGRKAAQKLKEQITAFPVQVLNLPSDKKIGRKLDPANIPSSLVEKIRATIIS